MDPSILLLIVTVGLLVILMTGQRRRQREQQTVQSRLTPGCEVMTSSGLFATVVSVDQDVVVLQTAPGQHSRWDRRAVVRVVTPADAPAPADAAGPVADDAGAPVAEDGPQDGADLLREGPQSPPTGTGESAGSGGDDPGGDTSGDRPPERR